MALGKSSRGDGRNSSNYCSTVPVAVFVAFCLVGLWIAMSSIVPVQDSVMEVSETINEVKNIANQTDSRKFENRLGDVPDESETRDSQTPESQSESHSESVETETVNGQIDDNQLKGSVETLDESKSDKSLDDSKLGTENSLGEITQQDETVGESKEEKNDENLQSMTNQITGDSNVESLVEARTENGTWSTQAAESKEEKINENMRSMTNQSTVDSNVESLVEARTEKGTWSTQAAESKRDKEPEKYSISIDSSKYDWKLCNTTSGSEYIPCLDNWKAIRKLRIISHYEHRERHCPDEVTTCLVSLPEGYRSPIRWPKSREMIWYNNAPHTKLVESKGHQNWIKVSGEYLTFPGGGTQFKYGALHYIEFIQNSLPNIAWGKRSRVILDVGCGVASFGGYLFEKDVLTMSFAPKDVHEAQVQFALERGIPATLGVMGTKRLPFPGSVFDLLHCARCRVPWHIEGGKLLLELNRVLRPGGYFVWSATPVYQKDPENAGIWKDMRAITKSMCWDLVVIAKDKLNGVAAAIYRKPTDNECYEKRPKNEPPMCSESDDPNAAWNVSLQACMHKVPVGASERGTIWPEQWPLRLEKPPYWLNTQTGVYGKSAPVEFTADYKHWKNVISHSYLHGMGINWSSVRNVMDMKAVYGGFAAALRALKLNVWVMNVVPVDSPDTLPVIYERGLIGIYHDWCESFSTYPRSYDLLNADSLFSNLKERCNIVAAIAEVDRMLRPEGYLIIRDNEETIGEIENMVKSLHWDIRFSYAKNGEGLLCLQKTFWRPTKVETVVSAIA